MPTSTAVGNRDAGSSRPAAGAIVLPRDADAPLLRNLLAESLPQLDR